MPYVEHILCPRYGEKSLRNILNSGKTDERVLTSVPNCMTEPDLSYTQVKAIISNSRKAEQQTMTHLVFKSLQSYVQRELRQAAVREVSVSSK